MISPARIDVHQHIVPPFWPEIRAHATGDASGGWAVPAWSAESAIDMMDDLGIATGILSPGAITFEGTDACARARRVNDFTAQTMHANPARFGMFAALPLPDIAGSLREITRCFDELHADGVVLYANYRGTYIGDLSFEPIWAELDRRAAIVFIHPAQPPLPMLPGIPGPVVDFPLDTTRAAVQMVINGFMSRYTNMKAILSHGGGFLPYASHRFAELSHEAVDPTRTAETYLRDMKRFYFDTALASGPAALPTLLAFAEPGHVLFGSDFPYATRPTGTAFTKKLDDYNNYRAGQLTEINRVSAEPLFQRLAK